MSDWVQKPWGRMKTYVLNKDVTVLVRGGVLMACTDTDDCITINMVLPPNLQGEAEWWNHGPCTVKVLEVQPGERLSDQRHAHRSEHWTMLTKGVMVELESSLGEHSRLTPIAGDRVVVAQGTWHRLSCDSVQQNACRVLEVSTGEFSEEDIERRGDDYGRV